VPRRDHRSKKKPTRPSPPTTHQIGGCLPPPSIEYMYSGSAMARQTDACHASQADTNLMQCRPSITSALPLSHTRLDTHSCLARAAEAGHEA